MGLLIYSTIVSLDGYVEDQDGSIDWSSPEEDLLELINDLERPIGTYLFGRRMYETMLYWETVHFAPDESAVAKEFQSIWLSAKKIVYSRTLESVSSTMTRVERNFDADAIRRMKERDERDITIGGSKLAAQALALGLVDELRLFVLPVDIGGGKNWLPRGLRLDLILGDTRRFPGGSTYASYRLAT